MTKAQIKFFLINHVHNSDLEFNRKGVRTSYGEMLESVSSIVQNAGNTRKEVEDEAKRLVETGQIAKKGDFVTMGTVIFEEGKPVSKNADAAANEIIDDLLDRRSIRQALEGLPEDVRQELRNTVALIIDRHFASKKE